MRQLDGLMYAYLQLEIQPLPNYLPKIIKLRAQFPDYPIKSIRLDNAAKFTSANFNGYCMSVGISVEHPVAHVHTQNGLPESIIKRLNLLLVP